MTNVRLIKDLTLINAPLPMMSPAGPLGLSDNSASIVAPSTSGAFRYAGARIDAEANGLFDFRARMYSPTLGRFLQTDPIGAAGGINLYAYVGNDPVNLGYRASSDSSANIRPTADEHALATGRRAR